MEQQKFETILLQSVIETFVYWYWVKDIELSTWEYTSPYFYYRQNILPWAVFDRDSLKLLNVDELTHDQLKQVQEIVLQIQKKKFNFPQFVKERDSRLLFLFQDLNFEGYGYIKDPETLKVEEIENSILPLIDENNLYAIQGYLIYLLKWEIYTPKAYFQKVFEIDIGNPYFLLRYGRYTWSTLYKIDRNRKFLVEAKEYIVEAFKNVKESPKSYFYSWLWSIEIELWEYEEALKNEETAIVINSQQKTQVFEPLFWKATALSKLWKHTESLGVCELILWNTQFEKRGDFRLYRLMVENYFQLGDSKLSEVFLKKCVQRYLLLFSFQVLCSWYQYEIQKQRLQFHDIVLQNAYNSFLAYYEKYISHPEEEVIFTLAFLYIQRALGAKISFQQTRNIEKLAFLYQQTKVWK